MCRIIKYVALILLISFSSCGQENKVDTKSTDNLKGLWLDTPAKTWYEAIPVGNGTLGGMVYGGVEIDTIKINEETLWSGEPRDIQNRHGIKDLPQIRKLLADGETIKAQELIDKAMLGPNNQSYLPMGDLIIKSTTRDTKNVQNYRRELDLKRGLVTTEYSLGETNFKKEVFASHPDKVIIVRLQADKKNELNFTAELTSLLNNELKSDHQSLILNGQAPLHAFPHYEGPKEVIYEDGKGMRFQMKLAVNESDGDVQITNNNIEINNASYATLILTAATSYNGFDKNPFTDGKYYAEICNDVISKTQNKTYDTLLKNHLDDYGALFNRVSLELGDDDLTHMPINERINNYYPEKDAGLSSLYYQFGRYLLISSSRPGEFAQPAHLQGIWSRLMQPAWSSNWTLNCNVQINYWPVETGNLSECHIPLIELTKDISIDGAKTAKNLYGVNGWMAHHNTDIWRTTSPVGGSGLWAIYQVGSGWLCQHLWEHYLFTQDESYLAEVYPYLKGAATFYLESLQENKDGYLVTSPSESFENTFKKPDGTVGWATEGATQDIQIIRELFNNVITASEILEKDEVFSNEVYQKLAKLAPMKISAETGRLQEWYDDFEPSAPNNGQVAHGWGLVVGNQISPKSSPEYAQAFSETLKYRKPEASYNSGSWTGAFPAMFYARLGNAEMSQKVIDRHIQQAISPNLTSHFFEIYWMIDGNLGMTATIGEMLMQSHEGDIHLLPALPAKYKNGEVKGLVARGGFIVDIKWSNNELMEAKIYSKHGTSNTVRYKNKILLIELKKGETKTFKISDF